VKKDSRVKVVHNRGYKALMLPDGAVMKVDEEPDHLRVASVQAGTLRKGQGTKLYEAAFTEACLEGKLLVSDSMRSRYAEAFWRKQVRKGRAYCLRAGRGVVYNAPLNAMKKQLLETCRKTLTEEQAQLCARGRMQTFLESLPQPLVDPQSHPDIAEYWPCFQWALDPQKCGSSLEGLRTRRRK
jgi:hypothetical protein